MKDFIKVLRRFAGPYMNNFYLNVFFSIIGTIAGLFSFAMIIPVLQIIFKMGSAEIITEQMIMPETESIREYFSALELLVKNNFNYHINHMIEVQGATHALIVISLILVAMTMLKTGFSYLGAFFMIPLRSGIVRDLRNTIFKKLTSMPLEFFSEKRKGDIMARITGDVQEVESSIVSSLDAMLRNPIMIIIYFIVMLFISWQLTLFVIVLLPLSVLLVGGISRTLKRTSTKGQTQLGVILSQIEESLGGLRVIKAFGAEKKVEDRFAQANEKFRNISNRLSRKRQSAHPVSELMGTLIIAVVLCYGGSLIVNGSGNLTGSVFIYYLLVFYSIVQPAKALSNGVYSVQKGMASMDRIDEVLSAESSIKDCEGATDLVNFNSAITYKDLSFRYNTDFVLKNINISIKNGETIALVGQSGSGKTTLAELLPRFYEVSDGSIEIDGKDIRSLTMSSLRSHMGYVNQEPILFNDTLFNNIAFGVDNATEEEVIAAAKVANAHHFIMEAEEGYQTSVGDRGGRLSGGQRQRISIARAILANPEILILDEATSALDTESERLVQEALNNLMKKRTTLVIAHRLSTIQNADRIYVIHEGEVIESGKHQELIDLKGTYYNLHEMQVF
jgi:subfamily B ATP-binding cassette protein MsbA